MAQSGCAFTCHVKCSTSSLGFQLSCLCSCCRNFDKRDETVVYFYVISNSNRSKNLETPKKRRFWTFFTSRVKEAKKPCRLFRTALRFKEYRSASSHMVSLLGLQRHYIFRYATTTQFRVSESLRSKSFTIFFCLRTYMETTLIWLLQVLDYVNQSLDQTTTAKIMPKLSLIRSHILLLVFLVQPKQGIILLGVLLANI